jgi:hypothetical protein
LPLPRVDLELTVPYFSFQQIYVQMKVRGDLNRMSYLIYWYGSKKDSESYGFLARNKFISYAKEKEKGRRGAYTLSPKIQQKIDDGLKLTPKEEDTVRAYKEMEEDLLKEPNDRKRGVVEFPEGYEMSRGVVNKEDDYGGDDDPSHSRVVNKLSDANESEEEDQLTDEPRKRAARDKSSNATTGDTVVVDKVAAKTDVDEELVDSEAEAVPPKKRGRTEESEAKEA